MYVEMIDDLKLGMNDDWLLGNTFLVFDLETTGVDVSSDIPVSYALLTMDRDTCISEAYSIIDPKIEIPDDAARIHGISTARARECGIPLEDALKVILDSLLRASNNGWYVVGMNVSFDLSMIDARSRAVYGTGLKELGFSAPILDTLVLDRHFDPYRSGRRTLEALSNHYKVEKGNLHNALEDCKVTYSVLKAIVRKFPEIVSFAPERVTGVQAQFHQSWVENYNVWASSHQKAPIAVHEWPIY